MLQCVAVCCSALQCVAVERHHPCNHRRIDSSAVSCIELQCVAVCCSVLHCVAVEHHEPWQPQTEHGSAMGQLKIFFSQIFWLSKTLSISCLGLVYKSFYRHFIRLFNRSLLHTSIIGEDYRIRLLDTSLLYAKGMQYTATHTATHCNSLQHTLQLTATHCNTLQLTATHCNALQLTATQSHTSLLHICIVHRR